MEKDTLIDRVSMAWLFHLALHILIYGGIHMDNFENYLFEKIVDCKNRITENAHSKEVLFCLESMLEEYMEIMSHYNLNIKHS